MQDNIVPVLKWEVVEVTIIVLQALHSVSSKEKPVLSAVLLVVFWWVAGKEKGFCFWTKISAWDWWEKCTFESTLEKVNGNGYIWVHTRVLSLIDKHLFWTWLWVDFQDKFFLRLIFTIILWVDGFFVWGAVSGRGKRKIKKLAKVGLQKLHPTTILPHHYYNEPGCPFPIYVTSTSPRLHSELLFDLILVHFRLKERLRSCQKLVCNGCILLPYYYTTTTSQGVHFPFL